MRRTTERYEANRLDGPVREPIGVFKIGLLRVVASNGGGWDHVSVSTTFRCPTWDEMASVKKLFFYDNECAMQLHVAEKEHINNHPFCLHLWRPQTQSEIETIKESWGDEWVYGDFQSPGEIPLPPSYMVGIPGVKLQVTS